MSSFRESAAHPGPSQCSLTVERRTSSKAERIEEYLTIPGLPDLTEEEVKLIDDIGRTHFSHLYVSSAYAEPVSCVDKSLPSLVRIRYWIVRGLQISRGWEVPRCTKHQPRSEDLSNSTIPIAQGTSPVKHRKNNTNIAVLSVKSTKLSRYTNPREAELWQRTIPHAAHSNSPKMHAFCFRRGTEESKSAWTEVGVRIMLDYLELSFKIVGWQD